MELNRIYLIINPGAGQSEPVLDIVSSVFRDSAIQLDIHVLEKGEKASEIATLAKNNADLIAVYGGDGSVTETATGLIGGGVPMAIIPGGTANVLAKELGIPQDTETALKLIRDGLFEVKTIDTGLVNGNPFLLRINLGIMADMITSADNDLKDKIGQLAYGVSTIKSIYEAEPVKYQLQIDGEEIEALGVSLTVTNSGSIGIADLQLLPDISINDGLLDVILLKDANILSLVKAAGGSLLGKQTEAISHWKCREIKITMAEKQLYICDDCEESASELVISVVPASLSFIIPIQE